MGMPAEPRPIEPPHYPIIYVRGYAATMREIEETVGTPYMGFNLGSTKVRQGHADDRPVRFIFESPLIRLMKDEDYIDAYRDGDFVSMGQRVDSRSVWIFRYYEQDSESFGDGKKDPIESYAEDLRDFILRVRKQVCQGDPEELAKFKVYLVAHSMGGLICRTYLQNVARGEEHHVDKVFTYATPHGGIEMMGLNAPDLGALDKIHVRNFNRAYMRKYLQLSRRAPLNSLGGAFSPNRFFCFVGTNYKDYDAFFGMSKRAAGPASDGLVMMRNAWVEGAPRAFAHRSHSGPFGIVNSEEGYQSLRRFLFGQVRIDALLAVDEITLPRAVRNKKAEGKKIRAPVQHRYVRQGARRRVLPERTPSPERIGHPQAIRGSGRAEEARVPLLRFPPPERQDEHERHGTRLRARDRDGGPALRGRREVLVRRALRGRDAPERDGHPAPPLASRRQDHGPVRSPNPRRQRPRRQARRARRSGRARPDEPRDPARLREGPQEPAPAGLPRPPAAGGVTVEYVTRRSESSASWALPRWIHGRCARHETARSVTGAEIGRASSPDVTHGQRNRSQLPRGREVRLW